MTRRAAVSVLLVGGGKMGGAMLAGWLDQGMAAARIRVIEPDAEARQAFAARGIAAHATLDEVGADFVPDVVVLAVKPQVMADVVPRYKPLCRPGTVFLSIAAGKTTAFFEDVLGTDAAVVRAMPNTPAAVRRGVSVLFANRHVSEARKADCAALLEAVGEAYWVADEALMDAVTAISGSGPAYVFLMAEALAGAGVAAGLPEPLATALARGTVAGSGELLRLSSEDAATLRRNVTSPGGTTAEALSVLMADDGLAALLRRAVTAAKRRSRELAG